MEVRYLCLHDVVGEGVQREGASGERTIAVRGQSRGARSGHRCGGPGVDGVGARFGEREKCGVDPGVGEVEAGDPAHGRLGVVTGTLEPFREGPQFGPGRYAVESAETYVDGMDGAAAEQFHEGVAGLLEREAPLDVGAVGTGQVDDAVGAEEVGGVQQVDVQGLALDPFAAVEQPAQRGQLTVHDDSEGILDRTAGAHLVGDRADAAHPGGHVGRLGVGTSAQERLEEPRGFIDLQPGLGDFAVVEAQVERTLSFDAGEGSHLQHLRFAVGHPGSSFRAAASNSGAAVLNVRSTRTTSRVSMPSRRNSGMKEGKLAEFDGPKQP